MIAAGAECVSVSFFLARNYRLSISLQIHHIVTHD
jgi:hypothetical protein